MGDQDRCLGIIETENLSAAVEAADAMLKSQQSLKWWKLVFIGNKQIAVIILGELGSVQAAIEVGAAAAQRKGTVLGRNVVPRCTQKLIEYLEQLPV